MVFLILSYLPVISLLRCKSVCKTWLSIINSPQFVEAHLANSKNKQASVLKASDAWRVLSMDSVEESVQLKQPSRLECKFGYMRSCNGFVCLSSENCDSICIWNPCTRQYKMVSLPNYANRVFTCLGFGFDSVGNDYKVLRLVRKVDNDLRGFVVRIYKPEAFFGKLYLESEAGLLPFDLRNDVFREIVVLPFPIYGQQKRNKKFEILDLEGSVGMLYESAGDESVVSLWILDDAGLWIKKFNLEMNLELDHMYLYLGAEQYLGLNLFFGYKFYNCRKKTTKELPFPAHLTDVESVAKFTESLVSLEGFESQE
ncbi:putative F-box protein At3g16210 [Daucus carota subsp. sativus]|uniref:putative F-box protein At3g16210 n=1 Tax=Daucus carota subsp. sativus TaxID=79200 RepID=UPI003083670E